MVVQVPLIEEADADEDLLPLYRSIKELFGVDFVPDMFRLLSSRPDLLNAVETGYRAMFLGGSLDRQTTEVIAAWTARLTQCSYCVGTHNFFVLVHGGTTELTEAIESATTAADLPVDEQRMALLSFVEKSVRHPWKITESDWDLARSAGWSTQELLEATFTSAMFTTITRLVDVLGLGSSVDESRVSQLREGRE